ncbi:MAG: hypothetical protein LBT29_05945, partial [Flavobacteriaceae bacterium]|nr:hypothetical protein [Flavobacteriaceae bacterium]
MVKFLFKTVILCSLLLVAWSCQDNDYANVNDEVSNLVDEAYVEHLSPEMEKVRDYIPENIVVAHRGSTFWTPEETEAAYRWAREIGADYLECDMQITKDGIVLALHDDNLARTTNIEQVYHGQVPSTRL